MEVLDEQLDSVTKFLRWLDSRIELFRERYNCDNDDNTLTARRIVMGRIGVNWRHLIERR